MIKVFEAPLNEDLAPFTKQLWAMRITHRVVFEDQQILIVENLEHAELVSQLYQYWQQTGEFPKAADGEPLDVLPANPIPQSPIFSNNRSARQKIPIARIPLVIVLLLISLALSLVTNFGSNYELLAHFTITEFEVNGSQINYYSLEQNFKSMELWRFISPIFVHFNLPHIAFNGLWIWVVGRVIESRHSTWVMLFIALFSGIASNLAQYYQTGPVFGGLSGVVYAVISYAWLWDKMAANKLRVVSNGLMGFMIIWLVLGYSGVLSSLGLGQIANTAHLAGLVSGLLAAVVIRALRKSVN